MGDFDVLCAGYLHRRPRWNLRRPASHL